MSKINTDIKKIESFLERGVENIYPNKEWLIKQMKTGKKLKMFLGIDPTGPTLHLGHAITLMKLKAWQKMGHKVVLLIGSFTGMIGDPTDKAAARQPLTRKQVISNAKKYKKQASIFISFSGDNPVEIVYNHKWLDKLTLKDMAELGMFVTTQRLLERDMFQERVKKGAPIYLTELIYPLLQGYDSVAIGTDGEIGGNDQTFNMLMGRDLLSKLSDKEKFVVAMKLLTDSTGKKMGKSEGNMVTMEDEPNDMFGKIMSWPDEFMIKAFELLTEVDTGKIKTLQDGLEDESLNPRDVKMELATEIVRIYHGNKQAEAALTNFVDVFSKGNLPKKMERISLKTKKATLVEMLYQNKLIETKSEARRLVEQGGVKINDVKIKDIDEIIEFKKGDVVKIGKKKFIRVA